MTSDQRTGPIEAHAWPTAIPCRAVTPGADPLLHGYSIERDLARHYGVADLIFLAATGELPEPPRSRVFEVALVFAAATSAADAPVHGAALAALTGTTTSGVLATASIALAEQARGLCETLGPWFEWLASPTVETPIVARAVDEEDRASMARLRECVAAAGASIETLSLDLNRFAGIVAALWFAGVRTKKAVEWLLSAARLPVAMGEALTVRPRDFRSYPMDLPPFVYRDPESA